MISISSFFRLKTDSSFYIIIVEIDVKTRYIVRLAVSGLCGRLASLI